MFGNNFYNPYMYSSFMNTANTASTLGKAGGIGSLLKKFSLSGFLNGASKTLNVVNQAIPIYYQIKPMITNAKTMFRVMSAVKSSDSKSVKNTISNTYSRTSNQTKKATTGIKYNNSDGSPTFFL